MVYGPNSKTLVPVSAALPKAPDILPTLRTKLKVRGDNWTVNYDESMLAYDSARLGRLSQQQAQRLMHLSLRSQNFTKVLLH